MTEPFDAETATKAWRAEHPRKHLPSVTELKFLAADDLMNSEGIGMMEACRRLGFSTGTFYEGRKRHLKARRTAPKANGHVTPAPAPGIKRTAAVTGPERGRVVVFYGSPKDVAEIVATIR